MDINQQPTPPMVQPPQPIEWTWIAQRQESDGKATSIWKFGFISPDGAEVRVTFHQVGDIEGQQAEQTAKKQAAASQQMQMGMPPSPDPTAFSPEGQPSADQTENATFYVTFFSNRHPEQFMRWDSSLSHEDSLAVWVTITHGIIDFVHKAKPANLILDDLSNGKLKMVLRSVAMDIVASNPEYEVEQTQRHHYRTFFQVKKTGTQSAFDNSISGNKNIEGDTHPPQQASPVTGGQAQVQAQAKQQENGTPVDNTPLEPEGDGSDKTEDPTDPQTKEDDKPAFASADPITIKQTATPKRGLTIEIGHDYSIAVKDKSGNAVDRYRAKGPSDILRWLNEKGYGANRMKIVDKEQPSGDKELAPEDPTKQPKDVKQFTNSNSNTQSESFVVNGNTVTMLSKIIEAKEAASMNLIINASVVRLVDKQRGLRRLKGVEFVFETDRDMEFKKELVELAAKKVGLLHLLPLEQLATP